MTDLTADPYVLTLEPIVVPKPWGGRRLASYGKELPDGGTYGESWEVADLPADAVTSSEHTRTRVATGAATGASLRDVAGAWRERLMGSAATTDRGDFPLLYKLLDAREHLSVQVHPDETYVAAHPGSWLKTESWYIVSAEPGAVIYKGLREGVARDHLRRAAGSEDMVELLQPVPARAGAFHNLPAGLVHALGAGVMVAEPQTPSDTTFRLYDWTTEYGRSPRELHLEEAVAATRLDPPGALWLAPAPPGTSRTLITTPHYWMREHASITGAVPLAPLDELRILSVLSGRVGVAGGGDLELSAGDTAVVPAAIAARLSVEAAATSTMLEIGIAGTPG